jgi:tRNA threonylcarbamoyl adenosine modification protein (Sua5/YciO/YrdC/YwlC family)
MHSPRSAAVAIARGSIVTVPTDTVYGLAADPSDPKAVAWIFKAKGRAPDKPLPVLGASLEQLEEVVTFDERSRALAARHWPGPLTIVLPRAPGFTHDLGVESPTVAVRVPASPLTRSLLELTGPLAVTSANPSGEEPAATAPEARDMFDGKWPTLDGGPSEGQASTIVGFTPDGELVILRPGSLTAADLTY